jgi:hypothetical protein
LTSSIDTGPMAVLGRKRGVRAARVNRKGGWKTSVETVITADLAIPELAGRASDGTAIGGKRWNPADVRL